MPGSRVLVIDHSLETVDGYNPRLGVAHRMPRACSSIEWQSTVNIFGYVKPLSLKRRRGKKAEITRQKLNKWKGEPTLLEAVWSVSSWE